MKLFKRKPAEKVRVVNRTLDDVAETPVVKLSMRQEKPTLDLLIRKEQPVIKLGLKVDEPQESYPETDTQKSGYDGLLLTKDDDYECLYCGALYTKPAVDLAIEVGKLLPCNDCGEYFHKIPKEE